MTPELVGGVATSFVAGSFGTAVLAWLRDRRRLNTDAAIGLTDVAARYWSQIVKLEERVEAQSQRIVALVEENAQLRIEIAQLRAELERVA